MWKKISLLFLILLSLVGCTSLGDAKMGNGAVDIYLEPNVKLEDIDWPGNYIYYTTRPMVDSDVAVTYSYSYRGSLESSAEVLVANFIETKLSSRELYDYQQFKANGGTIEDFLLSSGKRLEVNENPVEVEVEKETVVYDSESNSKHPVLDEFGYPKK